MPNPWLFDELAHAGPEHLDAGFVAGYDRKQGFPEPDEDIEILARHGLDAASNVVDLGAGTGRFALAAARRFGRVTAVDVSPVMLERLRERAAAEGLTNLDCVRAGFLTYAPETQPVDAVYTRNALHHLPDFWKGIALERIRRLLRAGGVLRVHDLVYDFLPREAGSVFEHWLANAVEDPAEGYTRADFEEHIRTEYSTYRALFEALLESAGFEIEAAEFGRRVYGAYTCLAR